jgi:hypothetical protein
MIAEVEVSRIKAGAKTRIYRSGRHRVSGEDKTLKRTNYL